MQGMDVLGVVNGHAAGTCPAGHAGAGFGLEPMMCREHILGASGLHLVSLNHAKGAGLIIPLLHPLGPVLIEILLNEAQRPPELVERGGELDGAGGGVKYPPYFIAPLFHLNSTPCPCDTNPPIQPALIQLQFSGGIH